MTTGSLSVLNFMKSHPGEKMTKQEIAAALEVSVATVTGSMNSLVKKGYATVEEVTVEGQKKPAIYHTLTDEGLVYDPEAEEAAAKEEKERQKAEKAAAKAAAKAAKE